MRARRNNLSRHTAVGIAVTVAVAGGGAGMAVASLAAKRAGGAERSSTVLARPMQPAHNSAPPAVGTKPHGFTDATRKAFHRLENPVARGRGRATLASVRGSDPMEIMSRTVPIDTDGETAFGTSGGQRFVVAPGAGGQVCIANVTESSAGCLDATDFAAGDYVATNECPAGSSAGTIVIHGILPDGASDVVLTTLGGRSTAGTLDGNMYTFRWVVQSATRIPDHVSWTVDGASHQAPVPVSPDILGSCR